MKILITGGAGFIGSAVVRLAVARGHSVINIDSLTYAASLESLSSVTENPNYIFVKSDIRDLEKLHEIFKVYKPDSVMHLAAESHVDQSISSPSNFIETNITGTFNMIEASHRYWKVHKYPEKFRFHHISTDEVFGGLSANNKNRFTEETRYDPRNPYSASKASADHLVNAWHKTYGLPIILTNCSNNFGPFQFPEKLVPVAILNALAGKPIPIYGNGENIRDWIFVEDHADALLLVLEKGKIGKRYNIGDENEQTNLELVRKICKILDRLYPRKKGKYAELITFVADRPGHDMRYAINPRRIRDELGWQTTIKFEQRQRKP